MAALIDFTGKTSLIARRALTFRPTNEEISLQKCSHRAAEPQRETTQFEKTAGHLVAIVDHSVKIHIALRIDR